MSEESTDFLGRFGGKDVLELAGLLLDLGLTVEGQAVGKQSLRQTMTADNIGCLLAAAVSKFNNHAAVADRHGRGLQGVMTRVAEWLVIVQLRRMWADAQQSKLAHLFNRDADRQSSVDLHAPDFRKLVMFFDHPQFFEYLIELLLVRHREDFLRSDATMVQLNTTIGESGYYWIMRHHYDSPALLM
jgi:hypothetical protein